MTKSKPKTRKGPGPLHVRIRELRLRRELTQESLATKCGVHKTAVSHWESGHSAPRASSMHKVADALGVKVDVMLRLLAGAA